MSKEIHLNGHNLIVQLSQRAMSLMSQGKRSEAISTLENCLSFLTAFRPNEEILKLQATILNNMGCFYKDNQQPRLSLKYLLEASKLEENLGINELKLASTYINICVAFSEIKQHKKALQAALKAIHIIGDSYVTDRNAITSYVLAHHNAGVEFEHLNRADKAVSHYKMAWAVANECLGRANGMTKMVGDSMKEAFTKIKRISARKHIRSPSTRKQTVSFVFRGGSVEPFAKSQDTSPSVGTQKSTRRKTPSKRPLTAVQRRHSIFTL